MRWITALTFLAIISLAVGAADDKQRLFRISKDDAGKLPSGWKAEQTGKGEGSAWSVVEDSSAPSKAGFVLAQTAKSPNALFNICVAENTSYHDVELNVSFKATDGKNDQGGGFVWRYQDNNNYYICRMNPLEDNYRVYRTVNGKRIQIGTKEELKVKAGEWNKLKVTMRGNHIQCYLGEEKVLDVTDDTFKEAGKVGLWTKSDAQTYFDGFSASGK